MDGYAGLVQHLERVLGNGAATGAGQQCDVATVSGQSGRHLAGDGSDVVAGVAGLEVGDGFCNGGPDDEIGWSVGGGLAGY